MIFTALARISPVLLFSIAFSSCEPCINGQGKIEQESTEVDSFAVVVLKSPVDVFISQNYYPRTVTIKAQQNVIDLIDVYIRNNELIIESDNCFQTSENVEVYINSNSFEGFKVQSSGNIHGLTNLKGSSMDIAVNGSGDVTAEVDFRRLSVLVNGSGDVSLSGSAKRLEVSIQGSGDVKGPNMNCESTSVSVNGSGDVYINAEKYLEANINGSGDIRYTGFPTDTSFTIQGSGSIRSAY